MSKLLICFTARPGHGSERGVGWAFVRAAGEYAASHGEAIHIVLDSRDEDAIREARGELPADALLHFHAVPLPRWAARRYGDSRSRVSYLAWLRAARRVVAELVAGGDVDVAHQVTFGTATLPSALPRRRGAKRIWGPLSVPNQSARARGTQSTWWREAPIRLSRQVALWNANRADLLIATNELTANHLRLLGKPVIVEPNIAVDVTRPAGTECDSNLLSIVGLLVDRKRPWLAIEALNHPALLDYRLQVIGDGPLRSELESLSETLGVANRVQFLGRLSHADTLAALAKSRLLLHPAAREGAAWVIGEAAALGLPTVAFSDVGAASTVWLSDNGGEVADPSDDPAVSLARAAQRALERPVPAPTDRWSSRRLPGLLESWWNT